MTIKAKQYKVHVDVPYALNANCKHYKGPEQWGQPAVILHVAVFVLSRKNLGEKRCVNGTKTAAL